MATLIVALLAAGLFFHAVASLGVLRLPDFYSRLHALSKAETLGVLLLLSGVAVWRGLELTTAKVLIVGIFFFMTNPTATHAVARAALLTGQAPVEDAEPPSEES